MLLNIISYVCECIIIIVSFAKLQHNVARGASAAYNIRYIRSRGRTRATHARPHQIETAAHSHRNIIVIYILICRRILHDYKIATTGKKRTCDVRVILSKITWWPTKWTRYR